MIHLEFGRSPNYRRKFSDFVFHRTRVNTLETIGAKKASPLRRKIAYITDKGRLTLQAAAEPSHLAPRFIIRLTPV